MSNLYACCGSALAVAALLLWWPQPPSFPAADNAADRAAANNETPSGESTEAAEPVSTSIAAPAVPLSDLATKVLDGQLTGFGRTSPLCLIRNDQVQAVLELSAAQVKAVGAIDRANLAARRTVMSRVRRARSPEERTAAWEQVEAKLQERHQSTCHELRKVLTTGQWRRLSQLALQLRGVEALFCQDVQDAIGLNERQRFELVKVTDQWRWKQRDLTNRARGGKVSTKDLKVQLHALSAQMESQLLGTLTPEQQELFTAMQGERIEWPGLASEADRLARKSSSPNR